MGSKATYEGAVDGMRPASASCWAWCSCQGDSIPFRELERGRTEGLCTARILGIALVLFKEIKEKRLVNKNNKMFS